MKTIIFEVSSGDIFLIEKFCEKNDYRRMDFFKKIIEEKTTLQKFKDYKAKLLKTLSNQSKELKRLL